MISTLFAIAFIGQTALTHAERAQELVQLQSAVSFCDRVGYAPIEGSGEVAESAFRAALGADGVPNARATALIEDARRVEGNRLARALDLPEGVANEETRRIGKESRAFVISRCSEAKSSSPSSFADSDNEGRVFGGYIGLWLDHPLVEEVEFYLTSRGACATFQKAFDAHDAAEKLARPFRDEPAEAFTDLVAHYITAYREGLEMGLEFDSSQCARLMPKAEAALRLAWREHFSGSPPYDPLD